jgi:hypothetical protein
MDVIAELCNHELDGLARWETLNEADSEALLEHIALFAQKDLEAMRRYCLSVTPAQQSSLGLVYKALSEHSNACDAFLADEVRRVVWLARESRIPPEHLDVLSNIDTAEMYDSNRPQYIAIVDELVSHLDSRGRKTFLVAVLELLEWFLLDYDADDDFPQVANWKMKLKRLKDSADWEVRASVNDALDELKGPSLPYRIGCWILFGLIWLFWRLR